VKISAEPTRQTSEDAPKRPTPVPGERRRKNRAHSAIETLGLNPETKTTANPFPKAEAEMLENISSTSHEIKNRRTRQIVEVDKT
jgi:hypothetical protein